VRRWQILGVALAGCLGWAALSRAQTLPQPPSYRYALTPQAGAWMICVKSYKGDRARGLAEELAEYIRNEHKLPAYLFDWGRNQRAEEDQRVGELRKQYDDLVKKFGGEAVGTFRPKRIYYPDEYAVLIGGWKDMETARKALDGVRKLKPPPEKLADNVLAGGPAEEGGKSAVTHNAPINPFLLAFVVPNPTIPKTKAENDPEKLDPFVKEINDGRKYNLLECHKPWTLVVKVYHGTTIVQSSGGGSSFLKKLIGKNDDVLNAGAAQAENLAEILRKMQPSFESYVLHTRGSSIVCVGGFDGLEDPKMAETQALLSKVSFRADPTHPDAELSLVQLNAQILPMKIPR
jgi:hypothetical protein